ncbi:VTT domain-containing protein [Saccharopolyspora indica]|uniref:TVP38/TMEM64 family protein n=1 Tax=Saccharopolyspora indica TaxID=1229659 RepID=UPI0022EAB314|nr:VTT domain-containing protein [Saccharopolyspora indica]MDA3644087.1 VTT domain-containing protein [Saccharopolyspora indica]
MSLRSRISSVESRRSWVFGVLCRARSPKIRFASIGLLGLLFLGAALWVRRYGSLVEFDEWRSATGPWAPLLFVLAFGLLSLLFVPRPALAAAVGVVYSLPVALPVVVAGTVLSAAAAFGVARAVGREPLAPLLRKGRLRQLDSFLERRGFVATVFCRLVPFVPFAVVNYTAGVTRVRPLPFLAGTAVGTMPANASYVVFGGVLVADGGTALLLASVLGGGALLGLVLARAVRDRVPASRGPGCGGARISRGQA